MCMHYIVHHTTPHPYLLCLVNLTHCLIRKQCVCSENEIQAVGQISSLAFILEFEIYNRPNCSCLMFSGIITQKLNWLFMDMKIKVNWKPEITFCKTSICILNLYLAVLSNFQLHFFSMALYTIKPRALQHKGDILFNPDCLT